MLHYVLKRLLVAVPVLIGVSILAFSLVRLVPGDTVTVVLGARYTEEDAARLRERYGLDRPLAVQYALWLGRVARGDLGHSIFTDEPVHKALLERLPVTGELTVLSILLALLLALPLGIAAANARNGPADYTASFVGLAGISVPNFWLGTLLILGFSLHLGWLPSSGFVPLGRDVVANLRSMIMPAAALGLAVTAVLLRMTRSSMLEVLGQEYIKMARAKGVGRRRVLWRHALKNALIPIVTVLGIQTGYLLGGSVVIESVFNLPGIGLLALQAINNRDYVLLQGVILFVATAFVLINLAVDVVYAALNPQIRFD